ncbi:MAG: tol-pal system protein YbgF [Parvibaculales bacterium]
MFDRKNLIGKLIGAACLLALTSGWDARAQVEDEAFFPLSSQLDAFTQDGQPNADQTGLDAGRIETVQILNQAPAPTEPALTDQIASIQTALDLITRRLEQMPIAGTLPTLEDDVQQEVLERLSIIETQLQGLSQASYPLAETGGSFDQTGVADLRLRLGQIEEVMRTLNGQIEDISFRLTKLGERFEQIAADTEFRFQELEMVARQGSLTGYTQAGGKPEQPEEPQVLGTIKVKKTTQINQMQDEEAPVLVGEARLVDEAPAPETAPQPMDTPVLDPLEVYDQALKKLRMGAYGEAQDDLVYFLANFKTHKLAGNAQYWLGETHYVRRDYKAAATAFLNGYTTFENSAKAPDSLLKLGMTLVVMGEKETGCDAFAELSSKFPDAAQSVIQRAEIERQRAGCL